MATITLREVTRDNWRATLHLEARPDQQRFVADYAPVAAIALAKAYVRPGGLMWTPYAIYAGPELVGLVELAYEPDSAEFYWIYHFLIDYRHQGRGYGKAALRAFILMVKEQHPFCQQIKLTLHPENRRAHALYTGVGFGPTGEIRDGEPVYMLPVRGE
jgi:diamine N-acetyltransferase